MLQVSSPGESYGGKSRASHGTIQRFCLMHVLLQAALGSLRAGEHQGECVCEQADHPDLLPQALSLREWLCVILHQGR